MQREVKLVETRGVNPALGRTVRRLHPTHDGPRHLTSTEEPPIAIDGVSQQLATGIVALDSDLRLVSLVEAASFLCVSRGTLYDLLRTGRLASVHIGRLRRIPLGELHRFVEARLESERRRGGSSR